MKEAGLDPVLSVLVKPPRVKASPCAMECKWLQTVRLNDTDGNATHSYVVFGEVVVLGRVVVVGEVFGGVERAGLVVVLEEVLSVVSLTNSAVPAPDVSRLVLVDEALFSSAVS